MKKIKKYNVYAKYSIVLILVSFFSFLGCEKHELISEADVITHFSEADVIVQSEEFQDYLSAYIKMTNKLKNIKPGPRKKIIENNGHTVYQYQTIDASDYKKTIEARIKLISKYPNYLNFVGTEKSKLAIDCINKSTKLKSLLGVNNNNRLKSGSTEDDKTYADWRVESFDDHDGQFNATAFDSFDDAVQAARFYGSTNNEESGIWKLPDGSAVFIIDTQATAGTMQMPYEAGIGAIAHYHPSGDGGMSTADDDAFDDWYNNMGINTSIIITQDSIYTYTYEE